MKKYYFHYLPPVLNPDPSKLAGNVFTPWSVVEALAPTATWAGGSPGSAKRKLHNHGSRKNLACIHVATISTRVCREN